MPPLLGVLGWPVAHSRSPAMMGAALAALGLPWRYVRLPVPPELFVETARALGRSGFRGANVTIPHKEAALALADSASAAARAIGAANTLVHGGEAIHAENTDAGGFLDALGHSPAGMRALVLGAGGAGRAVCWALREGGAADVGVWNRSLARSRALARELGVRAVERVGPEVAQADLLVNSTSIGIDAATGESEALAALGLDAADPPPLVADLTYRASSATPVSAWAARRGARTVDGLEVLVRQGARSLELWTAAEAPLEVMRAAARGAAGR